MLISYFCILIFPCLLLVVFVQQVYVTQADEYVMHLSGERLDTVMTEMDSLLEDIDSAANSIFLDSDFSVKAEPKDYLEIQQIRSKLNLITLNHRYLSEIMVYRHESDYMFSSISSYQKDLFCNIYHFADMSRDEVFDCLESDSFAALDATRNQREYKIFGRSMKGYLYQISVVFVVDVDSLNTLILKQLQDSVGMLCIMDPEGKVFAFQSNDPEFDAEHYENVILEARGSYDAGETSAIVYEDGINYVISEASSELNGYRYILVSSRDPLSRQVEMQKKLWVVFLVLLFCSGSVCILYLSTLIYRPINRLKEKAEKMYAGGEQQDSGVYDIIGNSLEYLEERHSYLQEKLRNYQKYLIAKLLRGELQKPEEYKLVSEILGFDSCDSLLYISLIKGEGTYSEKDMREFLRSCDMTSNSFIARELEQDSKFVVIWTEKRDKEQFIEMQFDTIWGIGGISKIVFSEKCCSLEQLSQAFIGVIALDEMTGAGEGIFGFEGRKEELLPVSECREIEELVDAENWQAAKVCLDRLRESCDERELYWNLYACMYLTNLLSKVNEYWQNPAEVMDAFMILKNRSRSFCNAYLQSLSAFFAREAESVSKWKEINTPMIEKMKLYLSKRYNDPNFSFQEMADEYSMSLPALSKFFGDKCGMTINDYVTDLKIKRAKYLLETTDMPTAEIGIEVGYCNAGSFSRRFRQVTGLSPSEYRKSFENDMTQTTGGLG